MKAYWFAFKPSDWLSSPDVRMMSKAERGTYINLLCLAWESTPTGHLPAEEDMVRRLAEMSVAEWQESGAILLKKFPLSACGTYRMNPRQAEEVRKQEEKSQINAEAGRRSAEKRAAAKAQQEANERATGVAQKSTGVEKTATNGQRNGNKTQTQTQTQSSNEDEKGASAAKPEQPLKNQTPAQQAARRAADNDEPLFTADTWPGLNNPTTFAGICADLRLPVDLNQEAYRATIQDKMRQKNMLASAPTLRSWISSFFLTEQAKGPLLTMTKGMPTEPTPKAEWPQPGKERRGQVIAFDATRYDEVMTRMKVAEYQRHWPAAVIHPIRNRQF